jgi:nitroreductase
MVDSHERIARIIALAIHAPSGDNAQPWRFRVSGDVLDVYNIPGKDNSPYNFKERGSFFAHGALIENFVIAASSFGCAAVVTLFPSADPDHVARIVISDGNVAADPLAEQITARATNRKAYEKKPLGADHKHAVVQAARDAGAGELRLVEDPKEIKRIARMISLSDRLIFEDKEIHDAIFGSIRWTEEEEKAHRSGLYVKTLELPPPARVMFRLFRHWPFLRVANRLSASKGIAAQSAKNYGASSAIGIVTIPGDRAVDFVQAGRLFQRVWLTATASGVSLQPITALAYLAVRTAAGETGGLSREHQALVLQAERDIRAAFGDPSGTIAMLFRVGYGGKPSAQSRKSNPDITYAD